MHFEIMSYICMHMIYIYTLLQILIFPYSCNNRLCDHGAASYYNCPHSVAVDVLKRANVCEQQDRDHFQHTFYKMYFLLLIIQNPLFMNILVYYFSFFRYYNYE